MSPRLDLLRSEAIVVEKLTKVYGTVKALDAVSLRVGDGEVFSLLGPNGAGKTTLVEILECLRTPTSGEAYVMGYNIRDAADVKKIKDVIGVLPQDFNAVDELTVLENVMMVASLKRGENSVRQILEGLGLWEVRGRLFSKLSGGMKRRVGIAMALVGDPQVVFLDEPTTGLDPQARRETWKFISELKRGGKTVVLTTHYMEEAERLSDRVAFIVKGRIALEGEVAELVSRFGGGYIVTVEANDSLISKLSEEGYRLERTPAGRVQVRLEGGAEVMKLYSLLHSLSFEGSIEVRPMSLENIFLSLVGARISETGELV